MSTSEFNDHEWVDEGENSEQVPQFELSLAVYAVWPKRPRIHQADVRWHCLKDNVRHKVAWR